MTANCSFVPAQTASDAGVAGAGVITSFIITCGLAITISAIIIFYEMRHKDSFKILRRVLNSLSDQQLITGIAIQSVGLAYIDSMVPYHFFVIWMLSILSNATHMTTLLALVNDFKRDWMLRWARQFLMFVNFLLSCVFGIYILKATLKGLEQTLPIACAWDDSAKTGDGPAANPALSVVGTIGVMVGSALVFVLAVLYLHSRRQRWTFIIQLVGLLFLTAVCVGASARVIMISQAFGTPPVKLSDDAEKLWSFGQLIPNLMLLLPLISILEITRGEMNVPAPESDDSIPMIEGQSKNTYQDGFQPNPFWGPKKYPVKR